MQDLYIGMKHESFTCTNALRLQVTKETPGLRVPPVLVESKAMKDLQDPRGIRETKEILDFREPPVGPAPREPKVLII